MLRSLIPRSGRARRLILLAGALLLAALVAMPASGMALAQSPPPDTDIRGKLSLHRGAEAEGRYLVTGKRQPFAPETGRPKKAEEPQSPGTLETIQGEGTLPKMRKRTPNLWKDVLHRMSSENQTIQGAAKVKKDCAGGTDRESDQHWFRTSLSKRNWATLGRPKYL